MRLATEQMSSELIAGNTKLEIRTISVEGFVAAVDNGLIILNVGNHGWAGFKPADLAEVRENLAANARNDPDFWTIAGLVELDLYGALAHRAGPNDRSGKLSGALASLERGYQDLYSRVTSMGMWSSVYDQARFILEKYSDNAVVDEEKDAAKRVLEILSQMATGAQGS